MDTKSNIYTLMEDMAQALRTPSMIMLGGGSPAVIETAIDIFQSALAEVAADRATFTRAVCQYSDSAGDIKFRELLAEFINLKQSWNINRDNILITGGSQNAFKILFEYFTRNNKKIIFPMLPDYIGYGIIPADKMLGVPGKVKLIGDKKFRYVLAQNIDLEAAGAMCISRPCNPTGGMIEDFELEHLLSLARRQSIPLIVDNAYGQPIPNIVFTDRELIWSDDVIYCLSLSKLGLPGVRTGIVISNCKLIKILSEANAKHALAPGGIGPALASVLIRSGKLDSLIEHTVKSWYQTRAREVEIILCRHLPANMRYHEVDGGFFNWLYTEDLKISGHELYEKLKANNVVVVPGYAFAPGLKHDWQHLQKCFRISTGQPLDKIEEGIVKIAITINNETTAVTPKPQSKR